MSQSHQQRQAPHTAELAGIVREAGNWAKRLLAVLEEEREALSSGDVAGIDASGQKKTECVAQLECLERERVDLCSVLGVTETQIEGFFMRHNAEKGAQDWQRFLAKLQRCQEANTINGQITQLRRRHVEQALQVLRGGASTSPGLYGPNGLDKSTDVNELGQA